MSTYALITVIESSDRNLNDERGLLFSQKRLYEEEAILCFESWRKNGGWLKDIPIYTFCPTNNGIKDETLQKLEELEVCYIEEYREETEEFPYGFWNTPLCGKIFEERLDEEVFIHTDLDMTLVKPLSEDLLRNILEEEYVLCGQYDDDSALTQRPLPENWENPLDTGFIISLKKSGFYKMFYDELMLLTESNGDDWWKSQCSSVPPHFLEEYVVDKMLNEEKFSLKTLQKYQLGEGYAEISKFTDEELKKVYFWHEHILYDKSYDKFRQKIDFFQRTKGHN